MKKRILIAAEVTVGSFLPLDKYSIELVRFTDPKLNVRIEESNTVMFSLLSYRDYWHFHNIYKSGRLKNKETVVGGAFLNVLKKPEQFLDYFNIDYLCIGEGERFIQSFCEGKPIEKVYYEKEAISQFNVLMDNERFFSGSQELSLIVNYRCRWNKCLFCHHEQDYLRKDTSVEQLGTIIEHVLYRSHIRRLKILDNDLDINFFIENILENDRLMSQLEYIDLFGLRCSDQVKNLEKYVKKYNKTVFDINLGLEFITQFFINLYRKGYQLDKFTADNEYLFRDVYENLKVSMYCLVGMPKMDKNYYAKLSNFIKDNEHIDFKLSYFLMDDGIIDNFSGFNGLEILDNITVNEFNSMAAIPALITAYRHFTYDGESQYDHYNKMLIPSGLMNRRNALIDTSLYPFTLPGGRKYDEAIELYKLKRYEEAASEARKVIELAPEKVDAYLLLGSCYEETKNNESALEIYEEALKISPDEGAIHIGLARVQLAMEHFQEAITEVDRARKLNYREDNVHFLLGYCYERTGRFEEAIEELRKAEGISPVEPQINFSLSNCYRLSGQIEQADKELDNALLKLKKSE